MKIYCIHKMTYDRESGLYEFSGSEFFTSFAGLKRALVGLSENYKADELEICVVDTADKDDFFNCYRLHKDTWLFSEFKDWDELAHFVK